MTYTKPSVFINTRFEALHHWPQAPETVAFLRLPHRHEFHVHLELTVIHDDREVEFILLKREVDNYLSMHYDLGTSSCEQIGQRLIEHLKPLYGEDRFYEATVSEDGENGATVAWWPTGFSFGDRGQEER